MKMDVCMCLCVHVCGKCGICLYIVCECVNDCVCVVSVCVQIACLCVLCACVCM